MNRIKRYGWRYWLGALTVVLLLVVLALVAARLTGATAGWEDNVGITLSLFMWPALLIYHFGWVAWHRQSENQT
jgi:hypothetical protein